MELRHQQIANEILIAREVMGTNNMSNIATELWYSPLLIINAFYAGMRTGKLTFDSKHDTVDPGANVEVSHLAPTDDLFDGGHGINLSEEIEQLIINLNSDKKDITAEELMGWIPGSNSTRLKMIAYLNPNLALYDLRDPKDTKSVYTFITLKDNVRHAWGKKQFKSKKK